MSHPHHEATVNTLNDDGAHLDLVDLHPELAAVVDDPLAIEAGEGRQPVRRCLAGAGHVHHREAAGDERVRDELPVAPPRDGFGTEHCRRPRRGEPEEALKASAELGALHVVGVAAEAGGPPGDVRRVGAARPPSPELGEPVVATPSLGERAGQRLAREVRMAPRGRETPHVCDARDTMAREEVEQLCERAGGMPDRVDVHRPSVAEETICAGYSSCSWRSPRVPHRGSMPSSGRGSRAIVPPAWLGAPCWSSATPSRRSCPPRPTIRAGSRARRRWPTARPSPAASAST